MKRYIKILFAALMLVTMALPASAAKVEYPYDYFKVIKASYTPLQPYYDFTYVDLDTKQNDTKIHDMQAGIRLKDGSDIKLSYIRVMHSKMTVYNTEYGAMQVCDAQFGMTGDDQLRTVTVRYYPTELALQSVAAIYIRGSWIKANSSGQEMARIDISEYRPVTVDRSLNISQTALLKFNGAAYDAEVTVNSNERLDFYTDKKIIINNSAASHTEAPEAQAAYGAMGSPLTIHTALDTYDESLVRYSWIYMERTINVVNGSCNNLDWVEEYNDYYADKSTTPVKQYFISAAKPTTHVSAGRVTKCAQKHDMTGKAVFILGTTDAHTDVDVYLNDAANGVTYLDRVTMDGSDKSWKDVRDGYAAGSEYIFCAHDRSWTERSLQDVLKLTAVAEPYSTEGISGGSTADDPMIISTKDDFMKFATVVNLNMQDRYKYFRLDADIDISDISSDIWAAVGTITPAEGVTPAFTGTFDGNGHSINVNISSDVQGQNALFASTDGATIKNLKVRGRVTTAAKNAAGIVSDACSTTIDNCISSVAVVSAVSGEGAHGGVAGVVNDGAKAATCISNTLFDGSMDGASTSGCGGFIGQALTPAVISRCISAGTYTLDKTGCDVMACGTVNVENCFYSSDITGNAGGAVKLAEEHKGTALINALGLDHYSYSAQAYPVHKLSDDCGTYDLTLDGTVTFDLHNAYDGADVMLKRDMYAGRRCTIFLPFDVSAEQAAQIGKVYEYDTYISKQNLVYFNEVTTGMKANTPYILEPAADVQQLTFAGVSLVPTTGLPDASQKPEKDGLVGTMKPITAPMGVFGYSAGNDTFANGTFVKVGSDVTLPSFCAYLKVYEASLKTMQAVFNGADGDITGIETLCQDEENPTIYTIDGRKLDRPERGICIINGRKVVVR